MDGAATWGQESLCCPKISCFACELLSSGTSGKGVWVGGLLRQRLVLGCLYSGKLM